MIETNERQMIIGQVECERLLNKFKDLVGENELSIIQEFQHDSFLYNMRCDDLRSFTYRQKISDDAGTSMMESFWPKFHNVTVEEKKQEFLRRKERTEAKDKKLEFIDKENERLKNATERYSELIAEKEIK